MSRPAHAECYPTPTLTPAVAARAAEGGGAPPPARKRACGAQVAFLLTATKRNLADAIRGLALSIVGNASWDTDNRLRLVGELPTPQETAESLGGQTVKDNLKGLASLVKGNAPAASCYPSAVRTLLWDHRGRPHA